jgi:hypothetical protein
LSRIRAAALSGTAADTAILTLIVIQFADQHGHDHHYENKTSAPSQPEKGVGFRRDYRHQRDIVQLVHLKAA